MYIIDKSYFQRELHIPNIQEPSSTECEDLELSIDRYVRLFLQSVLGNVLFTELDSYIINGELLSTAPQKWKNFINGCNYNDLTWKGLIFEEGLYKVSLLANLVYVQHYQTTSTQSIGQVVNEVKNGINVNPSEHLISIWNEFLQMYQGNFDNQPKLDFVNGIRFIDYYNGTKSNGYVNLHQFISDNLVDYSTAILPLFNFKNRLGL